MILLTELSNLKTEFNLEGSGTLMLQKKKLKMSKKFMAKK